MQNAWFLSRTDIKPSGWTATIVNGNDLFAPMPPLETYEQVYQSGPDVIVAGSARSARHEWMSDAVNHHAAVAAEADLQFDLITV